MGLKLLKAKPEALSPARHSFLWRLSRVIRNWEQRWYGLGREGFVYSKTPQGISLAKPVFTGEDEYVIGAEAEPKVATRDGVMMWGFHVRSSANQRVTLYSEDRKLRDAWVDTIQMSVRARAANLYLDQRFSVDYDRPLGKGLFAVVLRAEDKETKAPVAVKVIKAEAYVEYQDLVDREIMVWHAVGVHPHVVRLQEVLYSDRRVYFVAELAEGGNLMETLARRQTYTEADVARLTLQLLHAVRHLHTVGIVHMDLKPENIVLANTAPDSPIRLIDFSLASFFHTATEPGGTPEFVAPELLTDPDRYSEEGCGPSIDIWAVGVIVFYLLCGRTPFQADSKAEIVRRVKQGMWAFQPAEVWNSVSLGARDMVAQCLQVDPARRPTAMQLLGHPWLQLLPHQHSQTQLTAALSEFKAAYMQPESRQALRMSCVRRTGVMGHGSDGDFLTKSPHTPTHTLHATATSPAARPSTPPAPWALQDGMSLHQPAATSPGSGQVQHSMWAGGNVLAVQQAGQLSSPLEAGTHVGQGVTGASAALAQMQAQLEELKRLKQMRDQQLQAQQQQQQQQQQMLSSQQAVPQQQQPASDQQHTLEHKLSYQAVLPAQQEQLRPEQDRTSAQQRVQALQQSQPRPGKFDRSSMPEMGAGRTAYQTADGADDASLPMPQIQRRASAMASTGAMASSEDAAYWMRNLLASTPVSSRASHTSVPAAQQGTDLPTAETADGEQRTSRTSRTSKPISHGSTVLGEEGHVGGSEERVSHSAQRRTPQQAPESVTGAVASQTGVDAAAVSSQADTVRLQKLQKLEELQARLAELQRAAAGTSGAIPALR